MPRHGALPVRHRLLRREGARRRPADADIVVTNHALLAIDAIADAAVLPEHDYLVVDEAHELVDRVTSVATGELTPAPLGVAVPGASPGWSARELIQRMEAAVATFSSAIHDAAAGPASTTSTTSWPPT